MRPVFALLVLVAGCICPGMHAQQRSTAPDLILSHGHVFTADAANPWVEAIAIRGDRVVATGSTAAMLATADAHTVRIDLQGRMAMPGINDAHDHVGGAPFGLQLHFPSVNSRFGPGPDPSIAELAAAVKEAAEKAAPGQWIQGSVGVNVIRHPEEARRAMDEAAGDHPVEVGSWWGHGKVLNSRGLAAVGLTDAVKDPEGGHYDRDVHGHLTGLLEEEAGNEISRRLADQAGVPASVSAFQAYTARRLAEGVTSVQVMATNQRLSYLEKTFTEANSPLRVRIIRFPMPAEDARAGEVPGTGDRALTPRVRVSGVKYVLDGTPIEELAYRTTDYPDRPGWRGRSDYSAGFIDAQLRLALQHKDQLMMHIVGDAMTDQVLDAMEKLAPAPTWQPLRVRFEHGDGFTTPERMARAHAMGIVIAQPRPGRPWRSLTDAGIPLAYGSDGGMSPWLIFSVMTDPKNPEAIPVETALRDLTAVPAYAEFQETQKGSLLPGMLADVTVLSQDVTEPPKTPLPSTHSVLTIVGGKIAFQSPELAPPK